MRRWAQPSTAAAPTLELTAATVWDSAVPTVERRPGRAMVTTSSSLSIFETVPRCEILRAMKLAANAVKQVTAAVWNPGTGLNPATQAGDYCAILMVPRGDAVWRGGSVPGGWSSSAAIQVAISHRSGSARRSTAQ